MYLFQGFDHYMIIPNRKPKKYEACCCKGTKSSLCNASDSALQKPEDIHKKGGYITAWLVWIVDELAVSDQLPDTSKQNKTRDN